MAKTEVYHSCIIVCSSYNNNNNNYNNNTQTTAESGEYERQAFNRGNIKVRFIFEYNGLQLKPVQHKKIVIENLFI